MKAIALKKETMHVAHMAEADRREYHLLPLFHEMLMCPIKSTKAIVVDIATILQNDLNFYKYSN